MTRYGVVGVGSIAAAVVTGLCRDDAPQVLLSPRNAETAAGLAARLDTVSVAPDNQAVVDGSDVVIVAVLPGQVESVLTDLTFDERHVVISVVAGVGLDDLRAWTGTTVARSVPLPAVARREGRTPVHPPVDQAMALFDLLGGAIGVDDATTYEALTASSATVAAHFAFLGAITDWLVSHGLSEADARSYVAATFVGASESLRGEVDFDRLIAEVATPGGLNEQFAGALDLPPQVATALDRVLARLLPAGGS